MPGLDSISSASQTKSSTSSTASSSMESEGTLLVPVVSSDEESRSESSRSSGTRSDSIAPPPRGLYKCAVARALEDVQVMHAAGRHEALPPETVKIEGSDLVNCSVDPPGFGNDFTNPNWNWFNSQNPATIMDVINQDRSEADGAQEDAMHEDLKTVFGSNNKSSLQHPGPISVRPDQMARIMLIKCTHPLIHRRPVCRSAGGLHHTQDLRSC